LPSDLDVALDLGAVPVLPVFKWLAASGGISTNEMLRTFNCGIGMVLVVDRDLADSVIEHLAAHGENAVRFGEVIAGAGGARVNYRGQLDLTW
jgi:phosphoribosylformylglycinamidine cyclo-ligase